MREISDSTAVPAVPAPLNSNAYSLADTYSPLQLRRRFAGEITWIESCFLFLRYSSHREVKYHAVPKSKDGFIEY